MRDTIVGLLNKFYVYRIIAYKIQKTMVGKNPSLEMNRTYSHKYHENPNLINPSNLIEKIYWLLLHSDTSLWTKCADKYRMRDYVREKGFDSYLPKLYAMWEKPEQMDFTDLPDEFILKTNNACGQCKVVTKKEEEDIKEIKKQFKRWLSIPFGYRGAELHYTKIKPCIIAEELLKNDEQSKVISPNSLIDYKVWCINGKAESIQVVYDRTSNNYCLDLYDVNWVRQKNNLNPNGHYEFRDITIPKPTCLDEMISVAEQLAEPFPQVRVDFYILNERPYIGELTFTAGFGNLSKEYYQYLGAKIDLNKVKRVD